MEEGSVPGKPYRVLLGFCRHLPPNYPFPTVLLIFSFLLNEFCYVFLPIFKCVFDITKDQFWRRQLHPTPVLLPGKSHEWRSLVGSSPWGCEESDKTERLHFHFSLSCIGEGNGNPLQCSCLENPRDRGAWWAAIYGVTQSQTQLKRYSSSNSILYWCFSFWLISLCIISSSFFHLIRTDSNVFFLMAE